MTPDLDQSLQEVAAAIEAGLDRLLPAETDSALPLVQAMRYGAQGGGKRLRPFLVGAFGRLFNAPKEPLIRVGAALELVHCYSLIHDDLPAMDDAALRRGRPTVHRAFDEATAILAGDALLTLAFEALTEIEGVAAERRLGLVAGLGRAAGVAGMCGGQMLDLMAEKGGFDLDATIALQVRKTGALFAFACAAGPTLAGVEDDLRERAEAWGQAFGLVFQIKDDLLDVEGDAALAGKDLGRDAASNKATFITLLGLSGAKAELDRRRREAEALLDGFSGDTTLLRDLLHFAVQRTA